MADNSKLSQALMGNRNAAKDYAGAVQKKVGGAFATAKQKTKDSWEAVDKTVKYAAVGAAAGAATAVGGTGAAGLVLKAAGSTGKAMLGGAAVGSVTGAGLAHSFTKAVFDKQASQGNLYAAIDGDTAVRSATVGGAVGGAAYGAVGGAALYGASRIIGAPTPAKVAAGAVIGGVIGGVKGYKADRAEAAYIKKLTKG